MHETLTLKHSIHVSWHPDRALYGLSIWTPTDGENLSIMVWLSPSSFQMLMQQLDQAKASKDIAHV